MREEKVFRGVGLSVKTAVKHWRQEKVRGRRPPEEKSIRNLRTGPWTEERGADDCPKCMLP